MFRLGLACLAFLIAAVANIDAENSSCTEPGELGENALVQLGTAKAQGMDSIELRELREVGNTTSDSRWRRVRGSRWSRGRLGSDDRRRRRRAGTYTGTIPYKVQAWVQQNKTAWPWFNITVDHCSYHHGVSTGFY